MSGSSGEGEPEELDDDVQPSSVGSGGKGRIVELNCGQ